MNLLNKVLGASVVEMMSRTLTRYFWLLGMLDVKESVD